MSRKRKQLRAQRLVLAEPKEVEGERESGQVTPEETLSQIDQQIGQWEAQYAATLKYEGYTDRVAQAAGLLSSLKQQRIELLATISAAQAVPAGR